MGHCGWVGLESDPEASAEEEVGGVIDEVGVEGGEE
jgi:hypothetical protein